MCVFIYTRHTLEHALLCSQPIRSVSVFGGGFLEMPGVLSTPQTEIMSSFSSRRQRGVILTGFSRSSGRTHAAGVCPDSVCGVCERERESGGVERERAEWCEERREIVGVRERESVCVCVCVWCERRERERESVCVCVCVCAEQSVCVVVCVL